MEFIQVWIAPVIGLMLWVLVIPGAIMIGITMLIIIWRTNPTEVQEYHRLKDIVFRANDGQADAEHACENEPRIRVKTWWDKKWGTRKRYFVHRSVLYSCFDFR